MGAVAAGGVSPAPGVVGRDAVTAEAAGTREGRVVVGRVDARRLARVLPGATPQDSSPTPTPYPDSLSPPVLTGVDRERLPPVEDFPGLSSRGESLRGYGVPGTTDRVGREPPSRSGGEGPATPPGQSPDSTMGFAGPGVYHYNCSDRTTNPGSPSRVPDRVHTGPSSCPTHVRVGRTGSPEGLPSVSLGTWGRSLGPGTVRVRPVLVGCD